MTSATVTTKTWRRLTPAQMVTEVCGSVPAQALVVAVRAEACQTQWCARSRQKCSKNRITEVSAISKNSCAFQRLQKIVCLCVHDARWGEGLDSTCECACVMPHSLLRREMCQTRKKYFLAAKSVLHLEFLTIVCFDHCIKWPESILLQLRINHRRLNWKIEFELCRDTFERKIRQNIHHAIEFWEQYVSSRRKIYNEEQCKHQHYDL